MSAFRLAIKVEDRSKREKGRARDSKSLRAAGIVVIAVALLALGFLAAPSGPIRAADEPPAGSKVQAGVVAGPSRFVAESRKTLRKLHEELVNLCNQVLGSFETESSPDLDVVSHGLKVESAKANYHNAQLKREAAEITLKEYEEGNFKQEKASAEGELKLAEFQLRKAEPLIGRAKERLAKIQQGSKNTTTDLANTWYFEGAVGTAELQMQRAQFGVEQAKLKLKVLLEYTGPKTIREHQSELDKARSFELATKATWELEQAKLKKLQAPIKSQVQLTDHQKRILGLLDQAIPLEEKLSGRLDQIDKERDPDDALRKEIADLTGQLRALVDQAQSEEAATQWARLKARLQRAARR
jgi:hypothetical protein